MTYDNTDERGEDAVARQRGGSESGHLPECEPDLQLPDGSFIACICDRLRACEARVTERHNAEHEDDRLAAFQNGYDAAIVKERKRSVLLIADAYGKGLDAARDAVVAQKVKWSIDYDTALDDARAAIDALKGMSK